MRMPSNEAIARAVSVIIAGLPEPQRGWSLSEAATACVYWCVVHKGWRDGTDLGTTKTAARQQLKDGPLSGRPIGSIDPKVMNVSAVAQELLEAGYPIYHEGRYRKRGTGEDRGPVVCKGFAPAPAYQAVLRELLPRALRFFDLLGAAEPESPAREREDPGRSLPDELEQSAGLVEGARTQVWVNRYERSHEARKQCLEHHGYECICCGVLMADRYGALGRDYIHVHHLVPLGEIGEGYEVDPVTDLVPVCPNCHAMLHRRSPPLTPDELRREIRDSASSRGAGQP